MTYYAEETFVSELTSGFSGRLTVCGEDGAPAYVLINRPAVFCRSYELRRADDAYVGRCCRGALCGLFGGWKFRTDVRFKAKGKTSARRDDYTFSNGWTAVREGGETRMFEGGREIAAAVRENGKATFSADDERALLALLSLTVADRWD